MSEYIPGRGRNKVCAFCRGEYIGNSCHVIYCSWKCYRAKHSIVVRPTKIVEPKIKFIKGVPVIPKPIKESKPKVVTEESYLKSRLSSTKSRVIKKNVPFDLTIEVVHYIISHPCVYCGNPNRSEIDRKIPSLGYTIENCVSACRRCNTIKNNTVSYEDMIRLVEFLGWEHRT